MSINRREFVHAASAGMLVLGVSSTAVAQPTALRIRKDVSTLPADHADIVALKDAVKKMKALANSDKRCWPAQAGIHGTMTGGFGACQHWNWYFLPWHRAYLYHFEEIVRKLSGKEDFALPYWDWTKNRTLPAQFWGEGNSLANPARPEAGSGRRVTETTRIDDSRYDRYLHERVILDILDIRDFETFGGRRARLGQRVAQGRLENGPHNTIHMWVGGDMQSGGSPYDPIFWLHHCNVDRLYAEWLRKHPRGLPAAAEWRDAEFTDFCDRDGVATKMKVSQTLDTSSLGYRYDTRDMVAQPEGATQPQRVGFIGGEAPKLADSTATFSAATPGKEAAVINRVIAASRADNFNQAIRMRISSLSPPAGEDVSLDVFVNCELLTPDTPLTDPSYVGSCTWFAHGEHDHEKKADAPEAGGAVTFLFDVTGKFIELYGDRPLKDDEPLKVSLIARSLEKEGAPVVSIKEISPRQVSFEAVDLTQQNA